MKLKSCALSLMVASSQLLFGVYQTQLKAGDCYRTVTRFPTDTRCNENCTDGSGSCLSSFQKKYNPEVKITSCLPGQPSGFINCEPETQEVVVGKKWKCTSEVNEKGLLKCIGGATVIGIGIIAAAVATDGTVFFWGWTQGQVFGFSSMAVGSLVAYLECDYCSTHTCVVSRFDPGEDLKEVVSVKKTGQCPIPKV